MPGEAFFAGASTAYGAFMRLNFSHATPEQLDRGLAVLAEVIREQQAMTRKDTSAGVMEI